jgi:hypothetical protein
MGINLIAKALLACLLWVPVLSAACSITLVSPAASAVWTGYNGNNFTSTNSGCAAPPAAVQYYVDAFPAVATDIGALAVSGLATPATGYALPADSYNVWNGNHTAYAVALDALGNVLATSATNAFSITNPWPCSYTPGFSVATSTGLGSNWAGTITVTPTVTGTGAGDSKNLALTVDGIPIWSDNFDTGASFTFSLDTTKFFNGKHIIAVNFFDTTGGTTFSGDGTYVGYCGEWSGIATFSNSATPTEVWSDAYEMFLAPAGTHQLAPVLVNTDQTAASPPTWVYYSENTGVATVSSTGLVTAQTPPAIGAASAAIDIFTETLTNIADLACTTGTGCPGTAAMKSSSHPFGPQTLGQDFVIASTNGWTAGTYKVTTASSNNSVGFSLCTNGACVPFNPGAGSTGSGTYSTGPSGGSRAFVNSTNAIYHFGSTGAILSTYNPALSLFASSTFFSSGLLPSNPDSAAGGSDQAYVPGFTSLYNSLGFHALEWGCTAYPTYTGSLSTQTPWENSITSALSAFQNAITGYNFKAILTCDSWERTGNALFDTTRGGQGIGKYASWYSPPAAPLTFLFNTWAGTALAIEMQDEVQSAWNFNPLMVPATFANGGLTSISVSSGVCTINGGTVGINSAGEFIISGSAISGMNSVSPATYQVTNETPGVAPYVFNCALVANGLYGAGGTADSGLELWPFASVGWLNNTTGTSTSPNDYTQGAFAQIKTWINAASTGRPNATWANAAGTNCTSIYNWNNPAGGLADYATLYYTGYGAPYLSSRTNIPALITTQGNVYRGYYGCFSPSAPLLHQVSVIPNNYGFQGPSFTVTSFTNNTITTSTPHGVYNIVPGVTRLYLTNMSNSADNGNYYIISAPTSTTLTVYNELTDFTSSGITGGTLTFEPSGAQYSLISSGGIAATGAVTCGAAGGSGVSGEGTICGDTFYISGSPEPTHRGETFTLTGVAGTGSASFNTRTFYYTPENIAAPSGAGPVARYRELPVGSSTSGTVTIIQDNNMVLGRNAVTQATTDPPASFVDAMYAMILRGAGFRMYASTTSRQAYNPSGGYLGSSWIANTATFADTKVGNQLLVNPYFEHYLSVPNFHAVGMANLLINRIAPYALTASLSSPDYGRAFETTARTGLVGKMMAALNMTNAAQTRTFTLTPYLQSGQNIIRLIASKNGISLSTIASGTASDPSVIVPYGGVVVYLFPVAFASELQQPTMTLCVSDVANATGTAIRYGYDPYVLDASTTNVVPMTVTSGSGSCSLIGTVTLPADRKIGPISYRIIPYVVSTGKQLGQSDVQVQ